MMLIMWLSTVHFRYLAYSGQMKVQKNVFLRQSYTLLHTTNVFLPNTGMFIYKMNFLLFYDLQQLTIS